MEKRRSVRGAIRNVLETLPGGNRLLEEYRSRRRDPYHRRGYVGGMWEEIGTAQFAFMIRQGLTPQDVLVDVACGSLRGGRLFIPYLEPGHYLGLDHHAWLIEAGLRHEIPALLRRDKRPEFVISDRFEFHKFEKHPNYGLAQSLFSHLVEDDILLCLKNLRAHIEPGGRFFATFVPKGFLPVDYANPDRSDDAAAFQYDAEEIIALGHATGWEGKYIGQWGHPRGQEMLEFLA
jgi:hypothetical protein